MSCKITPSEQVLSNGVMNVFIYCADRLTLPLMV